MSKQILVEKNDQIAVITMNKPERRNAIGTESTRALSNALTDCGSDEKINAIVLTGSPPAFCAGSDLKELAGLPVDVMCHHEAETARVAREITYLPRPVVVAVEGYALGGGCILALSCDLVVSASNAKWDLPEVPNGWLPPWGLMALIARVGPARARQITWGLDEIDGNEARRLGMVDYVSEPGNALSVATEIAGRLAALPPGAVRSTKVFFEQYATADSERLDAEASRVFAADACSSESKATFSSFALKS